MRSSEAEQGIRAQPRPQRFPRRLMLQRVVVLGWLLCCWFRAPVEWPEESPKEEVLAQAWHRVWYAGLGGCNIQRTSLFKELSFPWPDRVLPSASPQLLYVVACQRHEGRNSNRLHISKGPPPRNETCSNSALRFWWCLQPFCDQKKI